MLLGQRGMRWARAAVAAFAGAAVALGTAGTASAEGPAVGVPTAEGGTGVKLMLDGKVSQQAPINFSIGDDKVPAYCIDFHTKIAYGAKYAEGDWDKSQVKNLGKVLWVLTHGYPNGDSTKLLAAAGVERPKGVDDKRLAVLLYFGTQTAVWHFSDGLELGAYTDGKGLLAQPQYEVVSKVREYLVANATDQPEPKPTLTITAAKGTAGKAGEKIGPFTVTGPAGAITLSVEGGKAVDADGDEVTETANGGRFWLTRQSAGEVKVTAKGSGTVSFGRVFLYQGDDKAAQKLILGGSVGEKVAANTAAEFTEAAAPGAGGSLPLTGASTGAAVAAGLVLLAAGAVTVVVVRRRRVRFTA